MKGYSARAWAGINPAANSGQGFDEIGMDELKTKSARMSAIWLAP